MWNELIKLLSIINDYILPKYVIKIINTQFVLCMVHIIVLIFQCMIPVHLRSTVNLKWQQIVYKIFSLRDTLDILLLYNAIYFCTAVGYTSFIVSNHRKSADMILAVL